MFRVVLQIRYVHRPFTVFPAYFCILSNALLFCSSRFSEFCFAKFVLLPVCFSYVSRVYLVYAAKIHARILFSCRKSCRSKRQLSPSALASLSQTACSTASSSSLMLSTLIRQTSRRMTSNPLSQNTTRLALFCCCLLFPHVFVCFVKVAHLFVTHAGQR